MKGNTKLKDFRNQTGLEQKEMAKEIHVSPSYYCKVETGYRKPSYAFLRSCVSSRTDFQMRTLMSCFSVNKNCQLLRN